MNSYQPPLLVLLSLLAGGCASMDKSQCRAADWQMIGIEDGAKGRALSYIGNHRKACAEFGIQPDLNQYEYGHQAGLAQFCTSDNGFKQGRAGHNYNAVCPAELRGGFAAGFEAGRELYQLTAQISQMLQQVKSEKAELAALQQNMDNVEKVLVSAAISVADRQSLLNQIKQMQTRRTTLENDIRDLELAAARKQGEYDVLDASHGYRY